MARVSLDIVGDSSSLVRAFRRAEHAGSGFGRNMEKAGRGALIGSGAFHHLGRAAVYAGGAFLGAASIGEAVRVSAEEMSNQAKVASQTAAALKSTGGVAGVTAKQIRALALETLKKTGIDDEATQSAENQLLAFTNIRNAAGKGNDIFKQATVAVTNYATRLNNGATPSQEQMAKASIKVGKALNDPVRGLSLLRRFGVQFSKGQEQQIKHLVKTGQTMEAQKVILAGLTQRYGGAAAAAGKTFPGQLARLKETAKNLGAELLQQTIPAIEKITHQLLGWLENTRNQATIQKTFKQILGAVTLVAKAFVGAIRVANRISGSLRNTVIALTVAFIALKSVGVAGTLFGWSSALLQLNRRARAAGTGIRFLSKSKIPSVDLRTAAATSKLSRLRGSFARLTSAPYLITFAIVAIGARAVAQKIKALQETALGAKDRKLAPGSRAEKVLVPRLAAQIEDLQKGGASKKLILAMLRRQFQGSAIGDDLISEAFRYTTASGKKALDKKLGPKLNDAARHVASQAAKAAAKAAALTRAQRAQRIERGNTIFDALIDRRLGRVQYLSGFRAQLGALGRIGTLLTARIAKTKDITRKLNLEDKLFDVRNQIRDLRRQQREAAVAAREARLAARSRKQFLELGLTGEGEERTPGKANLKKRLGNISEAIKGTFLDNAKTKGTLARIRKVLSEGLVPKDVRAKIKEMLDGINEELKNHGTKNATAFKHLSSRAFAGSIAGLTAAQRRAVAAAFAQTGAGGTRPAHGSAAFAGAGATTVHTTVNLDGKKVAHNTTHHQRNARKRRSGSRRGPYAGHD